MVAGGPVIPLASPEVEVRTTRDRTLLREFLEQDRLWAAYAICDLDEREFSRTRWGIATLEGRPVAVSLEYSGLNPQALFVTGEGPAIGQLLGRVVRTRSAYLASLPDALASVEPHFRLSSGPLMSRMWVDRATFRHQPGDAVPLDERDVGELNRLYELGITSWLPTESVTSGVYYGVRRNGRLVAAAGTHVISPEAGLAAVGNVFTHRDYRGRGFAKVTTAAVTAELLRSCREVVLNVRTDNPPALAAYAALGYREHVRFEERLAHRRGSVWDSIVSPIRRRFPMFRRDP
jgi:RimJ/RimL family protein N-acetyltransferase